MKKVILLSAFIFSFSLMADEFKPNFNLPIVSGSQELSFKFNAGQVQIHEEVGARQEIRCELEPLVQPTLKPKMNVLFDADYKKFSCEITLSARKLNVSGKNGQIQATGLTAASSFNLDHGQVQFTRNPKTSYVFDAVVEQGMKPMMPEAAKTNGKAVTVKIRVKNGMISVL